MTAATITCPHGYSTPASCLECMFEGGLGAIPRESRKFLGRFTDQLTTRSDLKVLCSEMVAEATLDELRAYAWQNLFEMGSRQIRRRVRAKEGQVALKPVLLRERKAQWAADIEKGDAARAALLESVQIAAEFKHLFNEPLQGDLLWGDATLEDFDQRIETLTKQAQSTLETVARMERARWAIKNAGVTCLRQIKTS